jgi:hypothetical protein
MIFFLPSKCSSVFRAVQRSGLSLLPLVLGACAVQHATAPQPVTRLAASPGHVSGQALELDGLPAQEAPSIHRRRPPDDPREPFSPNYGRRLPLPAPVSPSAAERDDLPWLAKQQKMSALSDE